MCGGSVRCIRMGWGGERRYQVQGATREAGKTEVEGFLAMGT